MAIGVGGEVAHLVEASDNSSTDVESVSPQRVPHLDREFVMMLSVESKESANLRKAAYIICKEGPASRSAYEIDERHDFCIPIEELFGHFEEYPYCQCEEYPFPQPEDYLYPGCEECPLDISDSESEVTDGWVEKATVVVGLPFLHPHSIPSPIRLISSEVNVDRGARDEYLRERRQIARTRHEVARLWATISPRRSPRLASKSK